MSERLSRRNVLRLMGAGIALPVLAACQPQVIKETVVVEKEKVVKETVVQEKVVKETVVQEKEVTKVVEKSVEKLVTAVPAPPKSGTIETWDFGGAEFEFIDTAMIPDFNSRYPGITIKHVGIPEDGYGTKIKTVVAAGTPPDVCVFADRALCKAGQIMAVDDLLASAGIDWKTDFIVPIVNNYCMIDDGKVYGMPTQAALWAGAFNEDLFKAAGLEPINPEQGYDFEAWYKIAKAINKPSKDISNRVWGTDVIDLRYNNNVPKYCGEDGKTVIGNWDSEGWVKMYQTRVQMWKEELFPIGDVGTALGGGPFELGKSGMTQEDYGPLRKIIEEKGINAKVCQFPRFPATGEQSGKASVVGWSDSYYGFKATKAPDAVRAWLLYLTTDGMIIRSSLSKYPPINKQMLAKMNWVEHNLQGKEVMGLLNNQQVEPFKPYFDDSPLETFWTRVTESGQPIEATLHESAKELQANLDKAWKEWNEIGK